MTNNDPADYGESSLITAVAHDYRDVQKWISSLRVIQWYTGVVNQLSNAASRAQVVRIAATIGIWIKTSYLYRWSVNESKAEMPTVDVRNTRTLGWGISIIHYLSVRTIVVWRNARVRAALQVVGEMDRLHGRITCAISSSVLLMILGVIVNIVSIRAIFIPLMAEAVVLVGLQMRQLWPYIRQAKTVHVLRKITEPPERTD